MEQTHVMTNATRIALRGAARDLHEQFRGIFGEETIEALVLSSYAELAATATVRNWLCVGAERFARQRLQASRMPGSRRSAESRRCCSSACTTPGAHRLRSAGSPTWRETLP